MLERGDWHSARDAAVCTLLLPTNEELMIVLDTAALAK